MKTFSLLLLCVSVLTVAGTEQFSPELPKLSQEEIGEWVGKVQPSVEIDKSVIRRGLISDQMALRADCARYLAFHGDLSDVPYLLDALSDESMYVGANTVYAGMVTTRYWANVALISITKNDLGYRWDDPVERRQEAIHRWASYWESTKHNANTSASPEPTARAIPPGKYSLSVGKIYESKPERPEWVFILGGTSVIRGGETVCKSPATLKALLKSLPRSSKLDWYPTCSGESKALDGHLDDMKKILSDANIAFTIHPAG